MAAGSVGGPRVLLRRLREVMAEPDTAQTRLDKIVRIIAANMVAEVCSVYLARAGGWLELFATEGLNPSAVHETRLKFGEGLVGLIAEQAEPVSLSEAPIHPKFAYRPETGEDPYHSLMGVPILRHGHVIGVLVVQNQTRRHYAEEEVEALQTVAMVLAEMLASGALIDAAEIAQVDTRRTLPHHLQGIPLAEGVAFGRAVLHEPRIEITRLIAEDIGRELDRLDAAIDDLRSSIDRMLASADLALGGEHRDVMEAYRRFAHDRGWLARLREAVEAGLTAEAAVERVQTEMRARLTRVTDPLMRERLHDLDDLAYRLLRHLAGAEHAEAYRALPADAVVLARSMGPAELLDYDRNRLRGVVIEEGSQTSHVAIVARALNIPLVGGIEGVTDHVTSDDTVIVDGDGGQVFLRPASEHITAYREKLALREQQQAQFAALKDEPAATLDNQRVALNMNAGLLVEMPHLEASGADGIGLFRTELHFMISATLPRLPAQVALYREVLERADGKPVVFRTLDIGGDKALPYMKGPREANPAMGWRAIRVALDRPALLRYQVRALLTAAAGRDLRLMFPMVADVAEFERARALIDRESRWLARLGRTLPTRVLVGTMLEVPSLAWQLPALLSRVDFVSVGSNDLVQFFFASDRDNPRLAARYDALSPSLLALLRHIAVSCAAAGVPVTLCGEMAARPLEAMALVGLGYRSMSMPAAAIGPVKRMVRSVDAADLGSRLEPLLNLPDRSLRGRLEIYARENGVFI